LGELGAVPVFAGSLVFAGLLGFAGLLRFPGETLLLPCPLVSTFGFTTPVAFTPVPAPFGGGPGGTPPGLFAVWAPAAPASNRAAPPVTIFSVHLRMVLSSAS
jgi:hypothetical protein